jgi:hypothetical protein
MPGLPQSTASPLDRYSEATRRDLYDRIKAAEFTPSFDIADPTKSHTPLYTAEAAELYVFFEAGRWFARWKRLEVPDFEPEAMKVELLRVKLSDESPWGYMLHEC